MQDQEQYARGNIRTHLSQSTAIWSYLRLNFSSVLLAIQVFQDRPKLGFGQKPVVIGPVVFQQKF